MTNEDDSYITSKDTLFLEQQHSDMSTLSEVTINNEHLFVANDSDGDELPAPLLPTRAHTEPRSNREQTQKATDLFTYTETRH